MSTPQPTYDPTPRRPQLALPAGACDTHVHVFGPATHFPYAPGRAAPADAPKETLFALHRLLGITRCVVVQSAMHGLDNRAMEDALVAGGGHYLGVALVRPDVPDAELTRLAALGVRGVRFNFMAHLPGTPVDEVLALTHRLAPLGLHLQVHFDGPLVHQLAGPLARSAVPVVIDHMGRVDARAGPDHADFRALHALLKNPLFRVKLSGVERIDPVPPYDHGVSLARALAEDYGDRCFWGTDWPHPNHTHVPDDALLVETLARIAPDAALRARILVHNPLAFYRFPA